MATIESRAPNRSNHAAAPGARVAPPERGETEVEIAERAAEGDRAEIDAVAKMRRARFDEVEP